MFQGSSELKHGTDSCIQSGQKARGLTAGEVGSWQFPGRIWWKWGEEGNRVECIWEDREGKGIRGGEAKELTQLPFSGGHVSLKVSNDGPTLIGANASFSVALHFPKSQKVLPNGQVIWANNTIINGEYLSTSFPRFRIPGIPGISNELKESSPFSSSSCFFFFLQIIYVTHIHCRKIRKHR